MSICGACYLSLGETALLHGLTTLTVGLSWNAHHLALPGSDVDLDTSVFILGPNGKLTSAGDFVFRNNSKAACGAVSFEDYICGCSEDDDSFLIDLAKLPSYAEKILICMSIYEGEARRQNFGLVYDSYVRIIDRSKNSVVIHYAIKGDYSSFTALIVGEIYKHSNEWKFRAVCEGATGGLQTLVNKFL